LDSISEENPGIFGGLYLVKNLGINTSIEKKPPSSRDENLAVDLRE
jgi:hypothetical protein